MPEKQRRSSQSCTNMKVTLYHIFTWIPCFPCVGKKLFCFVWKREGKYTGLDQIFSITVLSFSVLRSLSVSDAGEYFTVKRRKRQTTCWSSMFSGSPSNLNDVKVAYTCKQLLTCQISKCSLTRLPSFWLHCFSYISVCVIVMNTLCMIAPHYWTWKCTFHMVKL